MEVVGHAVVLAVLIGAFVEWIRSPAAPPEESWVQRLAVLVPLSVIAGTVLAVAASLGSSRSSAPAEQRMLVR